ncbi:TlpA family protein disulfide reductase [Streptococcus caprae]|uniref:TlpA family protein disulfide reductase n=1 Tax=Streptococcus caprae TaxID=1640501 RepID=A0ABV8CUP7_9STRE
MTRLKNSLFALACIAVFILGFWGFRQLFKPGTETTSTQQAETKTSETEDDTTNAALQLQGQSLPNFSLTTADGKAVDSSTFHDKPMLILEWASWCPHCQTQMPVIQELYEAYGDKVNFVLIDATGFNGETTEMAQKYMTENHYTMPWYVDEGMATADLLQMETTPTTYIVDENQTITAVFPSVENKKTLSSALEAVLK